MITISNIKKIEKEIYTSQTKKHARDVYIPYELCAYTPKEVYALIRNNKRVTYWLKFISNIYNPPPDKKILLLYPCSTVKPFWESRAYKQLFKTLKSLGEYRYMIHLVTISEPFGLVPEEFYGKKNGWYNWDDEWYDVPGLFEWWVKKYKLPYEKEYVNKSLEIIGESVSHYLQRTKNKYSYRIAFVRTFSSTINKKFDHTHRRIIEYATKKSGTHVDILPSKSEVKDIVYTSGKFAWDMYGISHPRAQEYLKMHLIEAINKVIKNGN